MRIITGKFKGVKLLSPKSNKIRPTSDRIKETLFNILQKYKTEGNILDLFAGSGALGIESLSRGAESVIFVDNNPDSCKLIKANLDKLRITSEARIWQTDFQYALKRASAENCVFDIIFADPPYNSMYDQRIVDMVAELELLENNGILVVEHDSDLELKHISYKKDLRKCGNTSLSFFQKEES